VPERRGLTKEMYDDEKAMKIIKKGGDTE